MNTKNFFQREQARTDVYNLLSALFSQPEDEILSDPNLIVSLNEPLKLLLNDSNNLAAQLKKGLEKYNETELLVEYSRLFVGPFKTLAPPYSSVYLGDGTVMNDHTVWVLQQYRNMAIDFNFELRDLPDHIAVENSFLYFLLFNQVQGIQEKDAEKVRYYFDAQNNFIRQHYAVWVPKFCEKGIDNTENDFYKTLFEIQAKMAGLPCSQSLPIDF
ncbi:MAG: molecular chaperone TorD family protein [Bacteroidota bacterium]|nr:molecular chaperone TorD family protein [Bacteroidota bacterium]